MGRKTEGPKRPDYTPVIRAIEHYLQHGTGTHPYASYEEAARGQSCGDAQRALVSIAEAMDRATSS